MDVTQPTDAHSGAQVVPEAARGLSTQKATQWVAYVAGELNRPARRASVESGFWRAFFSEVGSDRNILFRVIVYLGEKLLVVMLVQVMMQVMYESLCPDSIRFVKDQLTPAYETLGSQRLAVEFVPYGKATVRVKTTTRN